MVKLLNYSIWMLLSSRCAGHLPPVGTSVHSERAETCLFLQVPVFNLEELASIRCSAHQFSSRLSPIAV